MSRKRRRWIGWALAAIGIMLLYMIIRHDLAISAAISSLRSSWLDSIMLFIVSISSITIMLLPSLAVFLKDKKKLIRLWLSFISAYALMILVKMIVARPRPFVSGINAPLSLIKASYATWDFSFPSNHAAIALAALPFLPKKWIWPWIAFSILIMLSRVYFGLHYLSDVVFGAASGFLIGYVINANKLSGFWHKK